MKLFHIHSKKNHGAGCPMEMIVREENEVLAIDAVIKNGASPFGDFVPSPWFLGREPKPSDFSIKYLGEDGHYKQQSFSKELRSPETNTGPTISPEENACRQFMADRVVMMKIKPGGYLGRLSFALRLYFARKLRELAAWIDEAEVLGDPNDHEEE